MWLDRILDRQVVMTPDRIALRDIRRELTWRELRREVDALAALLAAGIPAAERVLVISANRLEVLVCYLACASAGVVVVPVNEDLADPELSYVIGYVEPRLAIASEPARARLAALAPGLPVRAIEEPAPAADNPRRTPRLDDTFGILHTSATTGHPKGAVVSHRSLQASALSWLGEPGLRADVYLNASPLFHGSMVIALDYLAAGSCVCVLDRFTPWNCLQALTRWRVEHALLVPSMIRLLLQTRALASADLSALQLIVHTAEPMPAALREEAAKVLGVTMLNAYGITEGGGQVITFAGEPGPPLIPGAACAGVPMLGVDARIADSGGRPLPAGEIGEILLRGDGIMQGYWRRPEATGEALRDGWLHTGDLGYLDDGGRFWTVDRRTDLILRGGQNVYPAEIERVLRASPGVADVAVVGAPSQAWGQTPWAFVQPADPAGYDEAALADLAVRELASYKRPSRFIQVEQIPRGPSGKILRRVLRERVFEEAE
jgi:acyl-CoA synthetase (AMP-forming)/AMP-acid ligase II